MARDNDEIGVSLKITVPVMTAEQFAKESGLSAMATGDNPKKDGVVTNLISKGHLPSVKLGKHRMVNVAAYTSECLSIDS